MSDLLTRLGQIAREEDALAADPRWEERARGTLEAEKKAELEALAEGSRIGPTMREASEPIGGDALDALTDSVLGATAPEAAPSAEAPPPPTAAAEVIPLRRGRRIAGALAGALAMAAALALVLRSPSSSPVPDFDLVVSHGELSQRSAPGDVEVPRFGPGASVELTLRPHAPVQGKVEIRGALVRGEEVRAFQPKVEITEEGAAHVEGTRESVFPGVPDGEWEIWLAIGRPEALPLRLPADRPRDPDAARILRARVLLAPERR